ncbi:FadR/GntR family transcriptional regulator [Sessilibacter corallicola]|uniref:FadR/GntR family transcriptional regulator n=1 Tax=Sessilibacter corallicola TaxID=2904075 RepID=UPI001E50FA65|nr:FadR/GntR family transcriptional regulator [Sessilibacter corallicola]MCE2028831.1 FadR family transcriptional regulator [Sessilibacter corallicola]
MGEKRLYRQVVEKMSALINSGEFPAGSRLPPERELAERFGVSRPTIREAIIALEANERVEVKTGSGIYVTDKKQPRDISSRLSAFELLEARVLVEGEVAALAASMISAEQIAALKDVLVDMENENKEREFGSDDADRRFHAIISEATNNQVLSWMVENLWAAQEEQRNIKQAHLSLCQENPIQRLKEHRAIVEALEAGDSHEARMAMRQHFARGIEALHNAAEAEAVAAVRRQLSETRERFSSDRLVNVDQGGTIESL